MDFRRTWEYEYDAVRAAYGHVGHSRHLIDKTGAGKDEKGLRQDLKPYRFGYQVVTRKRCFTTEVILIENNSVSSWLLDRATESTVKGSTRQTYY